MKKRFLSVLILGTCTWMVQAQENLSYQLPPKSIVDLVDAPNTPTPLVNSTGSLMLLLQSPGFISIEEASQPIVGIAGLRVNPANNSTEAETSGLYNGVLIKDLKTNKEMQLSGLPKDLRMGNISWSPDNQYFAFTHKTFKGVELWLADLKNFSARPLSKESLNDAFGVTLLWHPDGKQVLAQFVNPNRGAVPAARMVPTGPIIQQNLGVITPSRTYQYLLQNAYDETLMEYYLSSQLKAVSLEGLVQNIGEPKIYRNFSYSPDGNYILTQTVERPYSYLVPINLFPYQTSILKADGSPVRQLFTAALADKMPIGFDVAAEGPRNYQWRADAPATLVWVEAKDQGNAAKAVEERDVLYALAAPFEGTAQKLFAMKNRFNEVQWGNAQYAIVREGLRKDRSVIMSLINPNTGALIKTFSTRSSEDTYTDPGRFVNEGRKLVFEKANAPVVFTIGSGASPQGDRPFVMKWNLMSNKQDTLFKSKAPYFEEPVHYDANNQSLVFTRESADMAPNVYRINLKNKKQEALTKFEDPYPSLQGVQKTLLSYPRKDGVKLSATLYLPKGYKKEDGPLPALVWAYPREFKSLQAAGQVKGSPYRFTRLAFRSPVFWVTRGYAVLDNADMPIVGEGKTEPNDTFVQQIEENAIALINHVSDMGVVDRKRIGVGGHSYGAFMTANLLAHTDLFAAGIARSGAYNRTLTPFGFQGEVRTFWQSPEVYNNMSPFNYANKIKLPLLITHGMDDENSGTFPVQSERLYAAIKGHGGTVRLVLLPKEFHGYRSRESVLHTFYEQDAWLEKYVKNRK